MKTELVQSPWPLVAVHWLDAFDGDNGWTDIEKYEVTKTTVVSVGFLWPECLEGYVSLVSCYMPDEVPDLKTTSGPVHIPIGMVLDIRLLAQPSFPVEREPHESSQTQPEPSEDYQQTLETLRNVSNHPPEHQQ